MIPLFDLHCDTLLELYKNKFNLKDALLHISLEKAKCFSPYIQICAIWSDNRLNDNEAFFQYKKIINYLKNQKITFCKTSSNFSNLSFILAVEDARLLNNQILLLDDLYNDGVRVITLNWSGISCIGGGWNTDEGLTNFGRTVVKKCIEKGIIIDLSHSSIKVQEEVLDLSENLLVSPIFSHSNSYGICNHKRNIHDEIFTKLIKQNGVVGISLCPHHLNINGAADFKSILLHIEHFLRLDGENHICLGCDFDGISSLPNGVLSISSLYDLYTFIEKNLTTKIANKVFYLNAYNYFSKNLNWKEINMSIFAMADLHLSSTVNKPMDVFGVRWTNYMEKIRKNWTSIVTDEDTVIVPGDITWAINYEEAYEDFKFIESLPGKKLLGKGNHDYWWGTLTKNRNFLNDCGFHTIDFLYNNAFKVEEYIVCGTRGWYVDEKLQSGNTKDVEYEKIVSREAQRLKMSLDEATKLRQNNEQILVFFHFPPVFNTFVCDEIIDILLEYDIKNCYFGHIHGTYNIPRNISYKGINFSIISSDYCNFVPMIVMPNDY